MEVVEHCEAAENALEHDTAEGGEAQVAHGGAFIVTPQERGEDDDEKTEPGSNEAVGVFESDAAHHGRVKRAIRKRPVGNSESRVFGGYESTGGEEHGCPSDHEQSELVYTRVIGGFHGFRAP